jgi:hypothetical protein
MLREGLLNRLGLSRREVVGEDMDLLAARLDAHDRGEKSDESFAGVPRGLLAEKLYGLRGELRMLRQRAVAETLEAAALERIDHRLVRVFHTSGRT